MTTTELIKILQDNETGAISLKPREISLTINGRYMPNPQITLSSTGDGICGAEIDLDVCGEWLEQESCKDCIERNEEFFKKWINYKMLDEIKTEVIARDRNVKTVRSDGRCLFTAEEVLEIIDKYRKESED